MNDKQPLVTKEGDRHGSPSANATVNDRTGLYVSIIAVVLAALAVGMQVANPSKELAQTAERESRMAQYYIIEVDAKLIKAGIDLPDGGYQKFKEKRGEK